MVAIKLKDSHLLDDILHQRYIVRAKSCPNLGTFDTQDYSNCSDDPDEATGGDLQAGMEVSDNSLLILFV